MQLVGGRGVGADMTMPGQTIDDGRQTRRQFWLGLVLRIATLTTAAVVAVYCVLIWVHTPPPERASHGKGITVVSNLKNALDQFEIDNGRYPTTAEGLDALVHQPKGLTTWTSKSIDEVPVDKWGTAFHYQGPDTLGPGEYNIISAGPDRVFGTADDIDKNSRE